MAKPPKSTKNSKSQNESPSDGDSQGSMREAIESVVIAIILAFLFRAFEAEAFVIPTGSMATTLQGRHKDIRCPECGNAFQTGANLEQERQYGAIRSVTCPLCFYTTVIDPKKPSHATHTGDRILVNKFAYERPFGDPKRWDVVVFKFPGNAKQNYIKRLVGLENETVLIRHGDIYLSSNPNAKDNEFQIARKPPHKLLAILDPVHDSEMLAEKITASDWALHWVDAQGSDAWSSPDRGASYVGKSDSQTAWLNYRQLSNDPNYWTALEAKPDVADPRFPILVTDYYAYNNHRMVPSNWVGDLALEVEVEVESDGGELILNLIEAGREHRCTINVETGVATLSIEGSEPLEFGDGQGTGKASVSAETSVKGPGRYRLRFSNCDDQLLLWVGNKVVEFDGPTTYGSGTIRDDLPKQADLQPARIGVKNGSVKLNRLRVLRDIYYIAVSPDRMSEHGVYQDDAYRFPERYQSTFEARRQEKFHMGEDQFFVLGDNSPSSKDSRLWDEEGIDGTRPGHWVDRDMLIGKAVLIYWPHAIRIGIPGTSVNAPLIPNLPRMGLIR